MKINKYLLITVIITLFKHMCLADNAPMRFDDISSAVPVIKKGQLFAVSAEHSMGSVGSVHFSRLLYVEGTKRVYPEKDLRAVEVLLKNEKVQWASDKTAGRVFIPSIYTLYVGLSGALIDNNYYIIRRNENPQDREALSRLEALCPPPKWGEVGNRWSITFCVIYEGLKTMTVERYTMNGDITPFRIISSAVEAVDVDPAIKLSAGPPGP